jgi:hypothetical protein
VSLACCGEKTKGEMVMEGSGIESGMLWRKEERRKDDGGGTELVRHAVRERRKGERVMEGAGSE